MASVAGLAPARVGLKLRLRELLCIHGRFSKAPSINIQVPEKLQYRSPKTPWSHGRTFEFWCFLLLWSLEVGVWNLASRFARLVSEERPKRRDDGYSSF